MKQTSKRLLSLLLVLLMCFSLISVSLTSNARAAEERDDFKVRMQYFGLTDAQIEAARNWTEQADAHQSIYLGTPYGYTGTPSREAGPSGAPYDLAWWESSGMDCSSFLTFLFGREIPGLSVELINEKFGHAKYGNGQRAAANVTDWFNLLVNSLGMTYARYTSKEEMLSSVQLQKGDIVMTWPQGHGNTPQSGSKGSESHVMVYWGENNSDLAWHSTPSQGNHIGPMIAKSNVSSFWGYIHTGSPPANGSLSLKKVSANPGITDGNSCYSLEGATYTVYSDADCTAVVGQLVCDASGNTNTIEDLKGGTYYVKETIAPKGFALDAHVYSVNIVFGQTTTLNVTDYPTTDPVGVLLKKIDAETGTGATR